MELNKKFQLALNFDDGKVCNLKWARGLNAYNIQATFYINPDNIGKPGYLKLEHLKKMKDMGHLIANHGFNHMSPANGIDDKILLDGFLRTDEWLDKNGFSDGVGFWAFPYGSAGGNWKDVELYYNKCKQIRDVSDNGINPNNPPMRYILAVSDNKEVFFGALEKCFNNKALEVGLFHNDKYLKDSEFLKLLSYIYTAKEKAGLETVRNDELLRVPHLFQKKVYEIASSLIKDSNTTVLDLGCRDGKKLDMFIYPKTKNIVGIDNEDWMKYCSFMIPYGRWIACDLNLFDSLYPNVKKCDIIIFADVIEHLKSPDKCFKLIKNHIKKDGYILISTPDKDTIKNCSNVNHKKEYSYDEFKNLLLSNNFKIIRDCSHKETKFGYTNIIFMCQIEGD